MELNLIRPRSVQVEEIVPGRLAKIVFEPLERGYGTTIGNGLRRMLLSSIPGGAITEAQIEGVAHEFDTVPGVREDVLDILLTLKEVDLRLEPHVEEATLALEVEGPAVVRAGDFSCPAGVAVLNPDLVIAHVNEDGKLRLEARAERGRGYSPAAERAPEDKPVGRLLLDASFSPVRRVAVRVEQARVGQRTDYDKLILEVETNGAVAPADAVNEAARILMDQLGVFADFSQVEEAPKPQPKGDELSAFLGRPLDDLELSGRTLNTLRADGIETIGELVARTAQDLLRMPNLGRKSLAEIEEALARFGLRLGITETEGA